MGRHNLGMQDFIQELFFCLAEVANIVVPHSGKHTEGHPGIPTHPDKSFPPPSFSRSHYYFFSESSITLMFFLFNPSITPSIGIKFPPWTKILYAILASLTYDPSQTLLVSVKCSLFYEGGESQAIMKYVFIVKCQVYIEVLFLTVSLPLKCFNIDYPSCLQKLT